MKYKLVKVYSVNFFQYTNCMNDVVRHNDKELEFLDVGREPFLVREDKLDAVAKYGKGFRDIHFVGNMLVED